MDCFMRDCKRESIWEAIPIDRRKNDVRNHYYCDFCKNHSQEKNEEWNKFISLN